MQLSLGNYKLDVDVPHFFVKGVYIIFITIFKTFSLSEHFDKGPQI